MLEQGKVYRFVHTGGSPLVIEAIPSKDGSHEWLVREACGRGVDLYGRLVAGGFLVLNREGDGYVYAGPPRIVHNSSQEAMEAAHQRGEVLIY